MPTKKLKGTDYIYGRITADERLTSCQVKIRRKGFPAHNTSFDDLDEAKAFVRLVLGDPDKGHRIDRLASHRITVGDVIDKAIVDIDTGRRRAKGVQSERYRLTAFRKNFAALCSTPLADATEAMFEDWMEERLEAVKPNSVLREARTLKPLFEKAARIYDLRRSPMAHINPPREVDERVRRIDPDEEILIFSELAEAQDPIVLQAVEFALEAGCRRSEQLRVEWE